MSNCLGSLAICCGFWLTYSAHFIHKYNFIYSLRKSQTHFYVGIQWFLVALSSL